MKHTADSEWRITLENVIDSVMSIHFRQTRSFDTDLSNSCQATGFVVDAARGYILTNRHVVCAGPFRGHCLFRNHEEVLIKVTYHFHVADLLQCNVRPVYRDPIHDFGFLKFDPEAIKYIPVKALQLRPDSAKVGVEIKVVGNDGGEKLSILSGFISRIDRNAPEYAEGDYGDFNTHYIQAAAAATGGSSGSPVVNSSGHVVALAAGARGDKATTPYRLLPPLGPTATSSSMLTKGRADHQRHYSNPVVAEAV